jgi:uncharacterized protein
MEVPKTRLFFITDVHGSNRCFRKFLNAAKFYKANVLVLGGDITGKVMVPFLDHGDGRYSATYIGNPVEVKGQEALKVEMDQISDTGAYPFVAEAQRIEELRNDPGARDRRFTELIVQRAGEWMRLAETRLGGSDARCYVSPGNDDIFEIDQVLGSSSYVMNPEEKVVSIDGEHEMITLGYTNHTPWHSPREVDESVLAEKIGALASEVKDMKKAIFNLHVPPIGTTIDQAPKVSEELKYVSKVGQVEMTDAGSTSVRSAIERHQPMLGMHGHIHESRGVINIGRTLCANPGSEYGEGVLRGFLADIEGGRVKSYLLTSG